MKQLPLLAMLEQRTAMLAILEGTPTFTGSYLEYRSEGVTLRPVPGGALVVGDLGITGQQVPAHPGGCVYQSMAAVFFPTHA